MKNPFELLKGDPEVGETDNPNVDEPTSDHEVDSIEASVEEKKVAGVKTETEDGVAYVWKEFSDGSEDHMNKRRLEADPSDSDAVQKEMEEVSREWGLGE